MEEERHPGGRPFKIETLDELNRRIDAYFGECDPHLAMRMVKVQKEDGTAYFKEEKYYTDQKPYLVTGLALALGVARQTLLNYKDRGGEFLDTIETAIQRCEAYAEGQLYGPYSKGAMFNLNVNHNHSAGTDWIEKRAIEHSGEVGWHQLAEAGDEPAADDTDPEDDPGEVEG